MVAGAGRVQRHVRRASRVLCVVQHTNVPPIGTIVRSQALSYRPLERPLLYGLTRFCSPARPNAARAVPPTPTIVVTTSTRCKLPLQPVAHSNRSPSPASCARAVSCARRTPVRARSHGSDRSHTSAIPLAVCSGGRSARRVDPLDVARLYAFRQSRDDRRRRFRKPERVRCRREGAWLL